MSPKLSRIGWVPSFAVGAIVGSVYVAWVVAYWQLGRRPVPSMDDPKFIGGYASAIHQVMWWVILLALAVWVLGTGANLLIAGLPRTQSRRSWVVKAACAVAAMAVLLVAVRDSPGDACSWFLD